MMARKLVNRIGKETKMKEGGMLVKEKAEKI